MTLEEGMAWSGQPGGGRTPDDPAAESQIQTGQATRDEEGRVMSQTLPDFSRLDEHLDRDVLARVGMGVVGIGGAAGLVHQLARCGIGAVIAIDPDTVSATNIATQAQFLDHVGLPKVAALERTLARINPALPVRTFAGRYEDLTDEECAAFWSESTLVLAMTDCHTTQERINRDALAYRKPTLFAMMGDGLQQAEIVATLPETVARRGGCWACHVWPRIKAYKEGFVNRAVIGSHAPSAELLNAYLGNVTLALLHHFAGSTKPIARLATRFAQRPCLLIQLDPTLWPENPAGYGVVPDGMDLFTTKLFALDTPKGWVCEACGTEGIA
jgi:hypothetical protein